MDWQVRTARFFEGLPRGSVLAEVLAGEPAVAEEWTADRCPACGVVCGNSRSPYCGERCREESGFVRQVRAAIAAESPLSVERLETMGHVLWALLGGGHPERLRELRPNVIAKVLDRDQHACHHCGQPADFVEHLRTACNRPINLGAVCPQCRRTRDLGDPEFFARPEVQNIRNEVTGRIVTDQAARRCDDPAGWDWRAFLRERQGLAETT